MPYSSNQNAVMIAVAALAVALLGNVTTFAVNNNNINEIIKTRVASRYYFCSEIEKLKTQQRKDANENYDNRKKNAALLKIELTPELEVALLKSRDKALLDYKANDCVAVSKGSNPIVPKK